MTIWQRVIRDRFLSESVILMVLLWVFLTGLLITVAQELNELNHDNQQQVVVSNATQHIQDIGQTLLQLERFFESSEVVTIDEFERFCTGLCTSDLYQHVFYADAGIVTYVHPDTQMDELVDEDLLAGFNAASLTHLQDAIDTNGSFYQIQGNELLLLRPIIQEDSFVGIIGVSVSIVDLVATITDVVEVDEVVFLIEDIPLSQRTPESMERLTLVPIDLMGIEFHVGHDFHGGWYDTTLRWSIVIEVVLSGLLLTITWLLYRYRVGHLDYMQSMEHAKRHDGESGLKNRMSLNEEFQRLAPEVDGFFVAYGRFNNVKFIHYKYGYDIGSNLERAAIRLIEGVLRDGSTLYHLGGDEYIIVINTNHKHMANNTLKRVLRVFERDIVIKNIRTNISLSLGVVHYPKEGTTVEELIQNASLALGQSGNRNTNNVAFYDEVIHENVASLQEFDHLVSMLDLHRFELHFMPIARCEDNRIVGFECLSRAYNEFQETISTAEVINALERSGRIQELDTIVFQKVIDYKLRLNQTFPDNGLFLSVNSSALSLNEAFVERIIDIFQDSKLPSGSIILELTESYKVEDYDYLIRLFQRLDLAGIRTAIDDFGSGYSSLSYVSRFPVYSIKLDKTYVREYQQNQFNRTLFLTVRSIVQVLGAKLVAEGVDDPETLDFLRHNHCEYYQGFLLSQGVPYEDAVVMIAANDPKKD